MMTRIRRILAITLAVCIVCMGSTTALANDKNAIGDSFYQPGSAGMYCRDESGSTSFITGSELLGYGNVSVQEPSYTPTPIVRPRDIGNGYIQQVEPTGAFSPIVLIEATFPDGSKKASTGFMIGPTGVATTAHSIYRKSNSMWASEVYIYCNYSMGSSSKSLKVKNMYIGGDYQNTDKDDWGILTLYSSPNIGYKGYRATDDVQELRGEYINLAGYSGYFHEDSPNRQNWDLGWSVGDFKGQWARSLDGLLTDCDMFTGMSGSPIERDADPGYAIGFATKEFPTDRLNAGLVINTYLSNVYTEHSGR